MEATIAQFIYVKDDGSSSKRKILVLSKPSDSYLGVEIDGDDLSSVAGMLDYLVEKEQLEETLKIKYGLRDPQLRYRRFKEANIARLTEEKITI